MLGQTVSQRVMRTSWSPFKEEGGGGGGGEEKKEEKLRRGMIRWIFPLTLSVLEAFTPCAASAVMAFLVFAAQKPQLLCLELIISTST